MGQLLGTAGDFVRVCLASAQAAAHFMANHHLIIARLLAAVMAVALTAAGQRLLRATNSAGGATALVVALGAETATIAGAVRLVAGIVLVTAMGEAARRIILGSR
jgi:hypothetical protein